MCMDVCVISITTYIHKHIFYYSDLALWDVFCERGGLVVVHSVFVIFALSFVFFLCHFSPQYDDVFQ